MKIKGRVFSTDGEYHQLSEILTYDTYKQFEDDKTATAHYDNGATHFLMELDDHKLYPGVVHFLVQSCPNDVELGAKLRSHVTEVQQYINEKRKHADTGQDEVE